MSRYIRILTIILSAILISSCVTDRIHATRNKDLACITPKTRYDYGRNIPIRAIKSNNRKYARYVHNTAWKKSHTGYLSKNITGKSKDAGKLIYAFGETGNYDIVPRSRINEQIFIQRILESSENNLLYYGLRELPDPVRFINEPKDIVSFSRDVIPFPINKVNNESGYPYSVLRQEDQYDIMPDESSDEAGVSKQNAIKSDQSKRTPFRKSETFILMMAVLAGLIPLAAIKATPKLAENISFRAAMNPWKTRFMFAGIQIAMGITGVLVGKRLADNGIHLSDLSRDLLLGAFLTSSLLYPVRHTSVKLLKHSYLRQKAFDLVLAISGFMLMVNAGNDPGMRASLTRMVSFNSHEQQKINMLNAYNQPPEQLLYYQNDKQVQDEQAAAQKKEKTRKISLTILAVLGALVLGFLIAVAACGLACNGMEALAYVVGIGGGFLLITLAIWAIKSIWHPKQKKRIKPSEGNYSAPQEGTLQI